MKCTPERIAEIKIEAAGADDPRWAWGSDQVKRVVDELLSDRRELEGEIERLRKLIHEDHPGVGLRCIARALTDPAECGHHVDCLDGETGECGYCNAQARAETLESDNAALVEKVERLEAGACWYADRIGELKTACGNLELEDAGKWFNKYKKATTRAETAEANLAEAKAQGAASLADLLLKPEWLNRIQIDGIDSAGLLSQALDELDNQRVTQ